MSEAVADGFVSFNNDDEGFFVLFPQDPLQGHNLAAADDTQEGGTLCTSIGAAGSQLVTPRSISRMIRSEISCQREEMMKQALLEEKPMMMVSITRAERKMQIRE